MTDADLAEPPQLNAANPAAAARCRLYGLLARTLEYPRGELAREWENGNAVAAIKAAVADLPYALTLPALTDALDTEQLQLTYTALFDVTGSGPPRISLLARRYQQHPNDKGLWEELFRFYEHFGLDFSATEAQTELGGTPDHLVVQLEFLHYLVFLEAGAAGNVADLRRGQRDFIVRHPGGWVGGLRDALAESNEPVTPYDWVTGVITDFLDAEQQHLSDTAATSRGDFSAP